MRYSFIIASFAVAALAAPIAQLETNAFKREAEAQMSRQPTHPVKPGSSRPPPRMAAAENVNINDEIEPVTSGQNTENPVKSAEAGGHGRRSANPANYTPGTHAGDRRPGGGNKPKPKSKKPKRQMLERPKSSDIASEPSLRDSRPGKPPGKGPRSNANTKNEDKIEFGTESGTEGSDSGTGNAPRAFNCNRCGREQPSSEAVDLTTESVNVAESEAASDTSFGTNHVRLQRSAEPEPEAVAKNRTPRHR